MDFRLTHVLDMNKKLHGKKMTLCIYIYIYIYTHTHIHTHTHTHTHTNTQTYSWPRARYTLYREWANAAIFFVMYKQKSIIKIVLIDYGRCQCDKHALKCFILFFLIFYQAAVITSTLSISTRFLWKSFLLLGDVIV